MNKLIVIACLAATLSVRGGTRSVASDSETPDVVALLQAKYRRDMSNETGRVFWHGKRLRAIADPSNQVQICVYEDGETFRDPAKVETAKDRVAAANKKLKRTVNKQGVPKALAEARQRRADEIEQGVSNVTVTVRAGGAK